MPHDCYTTIRFVWYAVYVYFDQPTTIIIVIVKRKEKKKDRKETIGEFGVNVGKESEGSDCNHLSTSKKINGTSSHDIIIM